MRRVFKWVGIVLGGLVGLLVLAVVVLYIIGTAQLNKNHNIQAEAIAIPTDEAALARGEHLAKGPGLCAVCHDKDLSGDILFQEPGIGTVYGSNITGLSATHSDADLVLAIRHGVDTDGRQFALMPADIYIHFSAEDLGAIIAYLKTVPTAENDLPEPDITFVGRVMLAIGMFGDVFPAEYIDHNQPYPTMPEIGANREYGAYLAPFCTTCHGTDLAGGQFDPEAPPAPNLTPGGEMGDWSEAEFIQTMRTGVSPHGHAIDSEFMPWEAFAKYSDDELKALWMYLQSVPAVSNTE
jgi:cytochrome c553